MKLLTTSRKTNFLSKTMRNIMSQSSRIRTIHCSRLIYAREKKLFASFCRYDYFEIAHNLADNCDVGFNSTFVKEDNHAKDEKVAIHDAIENRKIDLLKILLSKSNLDMNSKRTQSLLIPGMRY